METIQPSTQKEIGQPVAERTATMKHVIMKFEVALMPAISKVISEYSKLAIGTFSQKDYDALIKHESPKAIKEVYLVKREKEYSKFPIEVRDMALTNVDAQLKGVTSAVYAFFTAYKDARISAPEYLDPTLDLSYIKIEDGEAVLDLETIKDFHQIKIQSEAQAEFYSLLEEAKNAWDKAVDFAKEQGYRIALYAPFSSNNQFEGFVKEGDEGFLELNHEQIMRHI